MGGQGSPHLNSALPDFARGAYFHKRGIYFCHLKPIFHCNPKPLVLGVYVGQFSKHENFVLGIPTCWYPTRSCFSVEYGLFITIIIETETKLFKCLFVIWLALMFRFTGYFLQMGNLN